MLSLNRFTYYQYQLEVHNDVGYSSGEIVTAVTMAGLPHHPPSLSAYAINHTSVQVNWTQPCKITLSLKHTHSLPSKGLSWPYILWRLFCELTVHQKVQIKTQIYVRSTVHFVSFSALQDLQGEVESYFLTIESAQSSQILTFPAEINSTVISDLWPSMTYVVSLQVSNGAHNTTKAIVNVTTKDGGTCLFVCSYFWVRVRVILYMYVWVCQM